MTTKSTTVKGGTGRHVSRTQTEQSPLNMLRSARARLELTERARERDVLIAVRAGHTQREIAAALGESQSTVHRLIRRARARQQAETPSAIDARFQLLRYLAGELESRGELSGFLTGARAGEFAPGNQVDGYLPDSWDEIRTAFLDGLIDADLYEYLRTALRPHDPHGDHEA